MRFSIRVQYGLQALLELALSYGGAPVQIGDIAKDQKIPIRFLEQILLVLKRGGLVASTRGKSGGYALAKKPSEITVLSLVEVLEGPIELVNKKMRRLPAISEAIETIQNNVEKNLRDLTLQELAMKERQMDRSFTYNI